MWFIIDSSFLQLSDRRKYCNNVINASALGGVLRLRLRSPIHGFDRLPRHSAPLLFDAEKKTETENRGYWVTNRRGGARAENRAGWSEIMQWVRRERGSWERLLS